MTSEYLYNSMHTSSAFEIGKSYHIGDTSYFCVMESKIQRDPDFLRLVFAQHALCIRFCYMHKSWRSDDINSAYEVPTPFTLSERLRIAKEAAAWDAIPF